MTASGVAERPAALVALLALAMGVSSAMQFALGSLAPFITADLGLTRFELGVLPTGLFLLAAVLSPRAGRIAETLGDRSAMLWLFGATGVAFLGMLFAPNFGVLAATVALMGVPLALSNPVTNLLVATHVRGGRQGRVIGVKQSGVQVAAFALAACLPSLAHWLGWRVAVQVITAVAVAGVVASWLLLPADGGRSPDRGVGRGSSVPLPSSASWLTAYAFLMGVAMAATNVFLPLYAHEGLGYTAATAGAVAASVGLVGVASRVLWGRHADRVTVLATPLAVLAALAAIATGAVLAADLAGAWLVWAGAAGLGASAVAWNSLAMLAVVRESAPGAGGRATARVMLGFLIGFVIGPWAFGGAVDAAGYRVGWAFVLAANVGALAVAASWRRHSATRSGD